MDSGKPLPKAVPAPGPPLLDTAGGETLQPTGPALPPALGKRPSTQPSRAGTSVSPEAVPVCQLPVASVDDLPVLEVITDDEAPVPFADGPSLPLSPAVSLAAPPPAALIAETAMSHARRRRKERRKAKKGHFWQETSFQREVLFPVIAMLFVWMLLVGLGLFASEMWLFLLIFGLFIFGASKRMLFHQAMDEGIAQWLGCMFVPFYPTYYFLTRPDRASGPFVVGCCGVLYLATSGSLFVFHHWQDLKPRPIVRDEQGNIRQGGQDDPKCAWYLRETKTAEALSWIQKPEVSNFFVPWQQQQAIDNIKLMYDLGAAKVWAVAIESRHDQRGSEQCDTLVVDLPTDPAARRSLFKCKGRWFPTAGTDSEEGQRYMLLTMPELHPVEW